MSETGDQFVGTSGRSTKHSARLDDQLQHEVEGMVRSGRSTHAQEWADPEPVAEGDPGHRRLGRGHAGGRHPGRDGP